MQGTGLSDEEKWERVSGMRDNPGTEGASVDPAKRACRPTHMPKKGLPEAMCCLRGSR